jgi:serine phosphatase RsbU (regulator of sigma subunit)
VTDKPVYVEREMDLEPDTTLLLYTDGVSERHSSTAIFGSEGILAILGSTSGSASRIGDSVLASALHYSAGRDDDLVVLTVRVDPGNRT